MHAFMSVHPSVFTRHINADSKLVSSCRLITGTMNVSGWTLICISECHDIALPRAYRAHTRYNGADTGAAYQSSACAILLLDRYSCSYQNNQRLICGRRRKPASTAWAVRGSTVSRLVRWRQGRKQLSTVNNSTSDGQIVLSVVGSGTRNCFVRAATIDWTTSQLTLQKTRRA